MHHQICKGATRRKANRCDNCHTSREPRHALEVQHQQRLCGQQTAAGHEPSMYRPEQCDETEWAEARASKLRGSVMALKINSRSNQDLK
jgi:hypothetical protein